MGDTKTTPPAAASVLNDFPFLFRKASDIKAAASAPSTVTVGTKDASLSTPVKSAGSRSTKGKQAPDPAKASSTGTRKSAKKPQQAKQQSHPSQAQQVLTKQPAVSTPVRSASNAYAGPTFHASPAPTAIPVPKFMSSSVPTGSSMDQYFTSAASDTGSNGSVASAPSPLSSTASSPSLSLAAPTFVMDEGEPALVQSAPPSPSPVNIPAAPAKAPAPRPSNRFGDSVVFRPRRKGGLVQQDLSQDSPMKENSPVPKEVKPTVDTEAKGSSRRAPAEFNFLFQENNRATHTSAHTSAAGSKGMNRPVSRRLGFIHNQSGVAVQTATV
ncbi:hypothetical protein BZA70DRAFT_4200 [Myxozyma melibiosi]|uniref:Uncharacterized protein n=1 Tax=Myxozyma melibiosi TaxID=54550 RepID=A0ABR1FB72_9ASCO